MHRRGTALLAVLLATAAGAFAAAGATAGPSTQAAPLVNSVTYSDSTGEDPAAPDITTVVVSNNDAADLTVQANISNRPGLTPDMFLLLFVDSDNNESTGDPDSLGADYLIQLVPGSVSMFRWNGSGYTSDRVSQTTLTYSYSNGATIRVNASELGGTTAFRFALLAASGVVFDPATGEPSFDNIKVDVAPDPGHGFFAYEVKITPLKPPSTVKRTYHDAARLPSRIRYVGKSIKHVRLGERLYDTMKTIGSPRVVSVACWSSADWPSVLESAGGLDEPGTVTAGFFRPDQPRWLHIAPRQCRDVQDLIDTRQPNGRRAYALATVLHERVHADGYKNEAQTTCYAVQLVYLFARELSFVHVRALYLAQLAVRKTKRSAPKGYWDPAKCRDGGKWDLLPKFRNLDY